MLHNKPILSRTRRQEAFMGWLFILPVVVGLLVFQIYPTLFSLYISMTRWNMLQTPKWLGLANFIDLFTTDRVFPKSLGNTATYALGTVIPGLALAIFFAMLLNQNIRGRFIYRAVYFIPVVAPVVSIAMLWSWIYHPTFGLLNFALGAVGIDGPSWLGSSTWALRSVIIMAIWQGLGYDIIIFLSGLQSISTEYYEAASIDGANALQKFFYITFPLLSPVTFFALVMSVISAFQVFAAPYVMTKGGPANSTLTVVMYLYNRAFRDHHMGEASAIAYTLFAIVILLTLINFAMQKKWVFYEESR